jgi:hypothetical protein
MRARKLFVAALLLLGLAVVTIEQSYFHSDDGCVLETHCQACLLQLCTTGVVDVAFSLPHVLVALEIVAPPIVQEHEDATPRAVAARGPPLA